MLLRHAATAVSCSDHRPSPPLAPAPAQDDEEDEMPPGFNFPDGICVDPDGHIFVADGGNHRIVRLDGSDNEFMTYAGGEADGFEDGSAEDALFNGPTGVTITPSGDLLVADQENHCIRKVSSADGKVSTVAGCREEGFRDGPAAEAMFNCPTGVACDKHGNIFVVDGGNHRIRKVGADGTVSTLAGSGKKGYQDGAGAQARFNYPGGIATDKKGNVYVADYGNHRIRMISADGNVKTLAGSGKQGNADGAALAAEFSFPQGLAVDPLSGDVLVADYGNECIRMLSPETGIVSTVAGTGEPGFDDGDKATFNQPRGVACDGKGNVYLADRGNHAVRIISREGAGRVTSTLAGFGQAVNTMPGNHEEDCADECCLPAPMMRKLKSKRAVAEEAISDDEPAPPAGDGAQAKRKAASNFGALLHADDTWG